MSNPQRPADAAGAKRTPCAASHSTSGQVVDPQAHMVERRGVHGGFSPGPWLHQVHLDRERPLPMAQMSSSTFSRSLLNVPVTAPGPACPPTASCGPLQTHLSGPPMAICWMPSTGLKGTAHFANSWTIGIPGPPRGFALPGHDLPTTPSCATNRCFHLHRLDHGHAFARLHLLARLHRHVDQQAGHGRKQEADSCPAAP